MNIITRLGLIDKTDQKLSSPVKVLKEPNEEEEVKSVVSDASSQQCSMNDWSQLWEQVQACKEEVNIVLVGKYTNLHDSYLSVTKALEHGAIHSSRKLKIVWVESTHLLSTHSEKEENEAAWKSVKAADGVLVPGGFGNRGSEGKIQAIKYARENNIPFLGICLGMQLAVIEFARHELGRDKADSAEF